MLLRAQVAASGMIGRFNGRQATERRLRDCRAPCEATNTRTPATEPGTWRSGDRPACAPTSFHAPERPGERPREDVVR
jgi:hypothetical protein